MKWSADLLKEGFERKIVGFDVRLTPTRQRQERDKIPYIGDWYDKDGIRLTIDEFVWPTVINFTPDIDHNGFRLLNQEPRITKDYTNRDDTVIVAYDVPTGIIERYSLTFGLRASPFKTVTENPEFKFFGFDVVGFPDCSSAFYSFSWNVGKIEEELKTLDICLNFSGVLSSEADAIRVAQYFDKTISEHMPFAPCGIWIKKNAKSLPPFS